MKACLSLELEEESMITSYTRSNAWMWDVMRLQQGFLLKNLYLSYFCAEIY